MPEEKPCCADAASRTVKKLTLPDGFQVGIMNLDNILKEVADLKLTDTQTIKTELLDRVKTCNYVASGVEGEYSEALFREYHAKFAEPGALKERGKIERHKHSRG